MLQLPPPTDYKKETPITNEKLELATGITNSELLTHIRSCLKFSPFVKGLDSLSDYEILLYLNESKIDKNAILAKVATQYAWAIASQVSHILSEERLQKNGPKCPVMHNSRSSCQSGYVYISRYGDIYKIGCTNGNTYGRRNIRYRITNINECYNLTGEFIVGFEVNCYKGFERYLHNHFNKKKVFTEFFTLTDEDLKWIQSIELFNGGSVEVFDTI